MTTPLHHLHAEPAQGMRKAPARSLDIGHDIRVRVDCSDLAVAPEVVARIAFLWNMHEGIPTTVLESGAIRTFYDSVQALVDELRMPGQLDFTAVTNRALEVERTWEGITVELTADGRRAACSCSEKVQP